MSNIVATQLTRQYGSGHTAVSAIADISMTINSGEYAAIMGESGAGKSTLLSVLGAMNTPSGGTLEVDGIDVYRLNPEQRADFRREFLGFVFQSFHLIPYLTVQENVMVPLAIVSGTRRKKQAMAMAALDRVGLADKADRLPGRISGGEKERVAVARAIVNEPPILLADEPTGNLDSRTTEHVMNLLGALNDSGMTIVMVTHSHRCARHTRRILTLRDGRLGGRGAPPVTRAA